MDYSYLVSDEFLCIVAPIVVYWAYSGFYMWLIGPLEKYRLHPSKEEDTKNVVSKREVAVVVLRQQLAQAAVAFLVFRATGDEYTTTATTASNMSTPFIAMVRQFLVAMFVLDTWVYFWHRALHQNKFLYRHVHSHHHRILVPYTFASQYNHPAEGFLLDIVGGALAFFVSGMSQRTAIYFFCFATMKGVDDHCGLYWFPAAGGGGGSLFRAPFWNNAAYHDVHHQLYGNKYNFSQPFFVTWDRILGTYMPYTVEKRPQGGLQVRPAKG